jgi:hypothetical protein
MAYNIETLKSLSNKLKGSFELGPKEYNVHINLQQISLKNIQ